MMNASPCPDRQTYVDALNRQIQSMDHLQFQKFLLRLYRDLVKAIMDFLESLTLSLGSSGDAGGDWARTLAIVFVALIGAVILAVVFIIFRNLRRNPGRRTFLGETLAAGVTVPALQEKAELLFRQGEYRLAVRYRFIGILLYLHDGNILHHDESMTGSEMVRKLRSEAYQAAEPFEGLALAFNACWYGKTDIDAETHRQWMLIEERFWKEAGRHEET